MTPEEKHRQTPGGGYGNIIANGKRKAAGSDAALSCNEHANCVFMEEAQD